MSFVFFSCVREPSFDGCPVLELVNLDILEGADHVTRLYVAIEGVNDQPVLTRLRNNFVVLNDYLPPKTNIGFNISFLITDVEVRHKTLLQCAYTLWLLI